MADKTKIEWTDATVNPMTGCEKISAGCKHCYAHTFAERWRGVGGNYFEHGFDFQLRPEMLMKPLQWKKPRRIFIASMSDVFYREVPDDYLDRLFAVMASCPQHTFQVLTKRPERMRDYLVTPDRYLRVAQACEELSKSFPTAKHSRDPNGGNAWNTMAASENLRLGNEQSSWPGWPLRNVWLGVTVENQAAADERIPLLLQTPASVRFLSCEPLLGPVDLRPQADDVYQMLSEWYGPQGFDPDGSQPKRDRIEGYFPRIDWVIAGGESGPGARPMHPDWVRGIRDQVVAAGIPFLFKQWGEWVTEVQAPDDIVLPSRSFFPQGWSMKGPDVYHVGKVAAGRELDGRTWDQFPEVR